MWVDLYDFAVRTGFLGIGVWGNEKSAPNWTAEELGESFLRVLGDGMGQRLQDRSGSDQSCQGNLQIGSIWVKVELEIAFSERRAQGVALNLDQFNELLIIYQVFPSIDKKVQFQWNNLDELNPVVAM
jgi:hypothetical protein